MAVLVVADHANGALDPVTARTVTAALAMGGDVDLLVAGQGVAAVADDASKLAGIRRVLLADAPGFAHQVAEPMSKLVAGLAEGYGAILGSASSMAKNLMPRVAALLDVMQISEIIDIVAPDTLRRPVYAGNAIETVRSRDRKKVITVRTTAFAPVGSGNSAPIETLAVAAETGGAAFVGLKASGSDRPDLGSAKIVVSGGRALGSKEAFDRVILPLADRLGAAVGATRAAVDAGYVASDRQVGQTGKVVAPELYIACGISGAIQHLAGMKDSKVIVAINTDPDAPIFEIADYGLVADIFEAVPELTKKL
ncbi:MAG: electron transfer flavoprotein subunit alpha/FixB family protein [Hyphomicrobiaceae bacterium]|nr:electron transfer flavoprotein subunit alpha/FixB family protein [Hyphomicrobiaceae bacterium]